MHRKRYYLYKNRNFYYLSLLCLSNGLFIKLIKRKLVLAIIVNKRLYLKIFK